MRVSAYSNNSQLYFSSDKWFGVVGGNARVSLQHEVDIFKTFVAEVAPKVGIGWGRIEQVQDARQAVYILEKLSKHGIMTKHLSDEEVNRFAHLISTVKNKRFLDSRLHLIDEITAVDSFLVSNKYVSDQGPKFYTTLYDYWAYGDLFERLSGLEVKFEGTPSFSRKSLTSHKANVAAVSLLASIQYSKPINLYWQHNASAHAEYLYVNENIRRPNVDRFNSESQNANLAGSYSFGYYPNSRTNINFVIEEKLNFDLKSDLFSSQTNLLCKAYYYISPQLRLSAEAGIGYQHSDLITQTQKRVAGLYSVALTYALF